MVKLDANCLGGKIGKTKVIFQGSNFPLPCFHIWKDEYTNGFLFGKNKVMCLYTVLFFWTLKT